MPGPTDWHTVGVVLSRRWSAFLLGFGVWSWVIWPTFLRNISHDPRASHAGHPTGFFVVHALLTAASLTFGTAIGLLGLRGLRSSRAGAAVPVRADLPPDQPLVSGPSVPTT